jgi:RNA polymerase sigma-B factor
MSTSMGVNREESRSLLEALSVLSADDPQRDDVRAQLVALHQPLVEHLARRFRNRGEPYDDLVQVATIGLIKAIDRYDPERGVEFSTYATPTIVGEIKRWFRDKGWAVRVPRRLQELRLEIGSATAALTQEFGRSPTVLEGLESAAAYSTLSLDAPEGSESDGPSVLDMLGGEDDALEGVENREALKPLLAGLPERERRILVLRFFAGMTQSQIAIEVGISQMHVSRLLARTLVKLREGLLVDEV